MNKIKRLSTIFKFIFYLLLVAYPLLVIAFWLAPLALTSQGVNFGIPQGTKILHSLSWSEKGTGFLISLVPNLLTVAVIYCLARLFALYEQGKIFVVESSRYLRRVGFLLLIGNIISPLIVNPLMQAVMTMHNPTGQRYASITFGTNDLYNIFVALLIILISWIMTEACKIHEEQQLTV